MTSQKPVVGLIVAVPFAVVVLIAFRASAMAPANGFRVVESTAAHVRLEIGAGTRVNTVIRGYEKKYRDAVGEPLTWRRIYNANADRVLALCESRGYQGQKVRDTGPWRNCEPKHQSIMFIGGQTGIITIPFAPISDELPSTPAVAATSSATVAASAAPPAASSVRMPSIPIASASAYGVHPSLLEPIGPPPLGGRVVLPPPSNRPRGAWSVAVAWLTRVLPVRVWQAAACGLAVLALIALALWSHRVKNRLWKAVVEMRALLASTHTQLEERRCVIEAQVSELETVRASEKKAVHAVIDLEKRFADALRTLCALLGIPLTDETTFESVIAATLSLNERVQEFEQTRQDHQVALEEMRAEVLLLSGKARADSAVAWKRIQELEDEMRLLRESAAESDECARTLRGSVAEKQKEIASLAVRMADAVKELQEAKGREARAIHAAERVVADRDRKLKLVLDALLPIARALGIPVRTGEDTPVTATITFLCDRISGEWTRRYSAHPDFLSTPRPDPHGFIPVQTQPGVAGPAPGTMHPSPGTISRLPPPPPRPRGMGASERVGTYSSHRPNGGTRPSDTQVTPVSQSIVSDDEVPGPTPRV